jgi:hypothetical protein
MLDCTNLAGFRLDVLRVATGDSAIPSKRRRRNVHGPSDPGGSLYVEKMTKISTLHIFSGDSSNPKLGTSQSVCLKVRSPMESQLDRPTVNLCTRVHVAVDLTFVLATKV